MHASPVHSLHTTNETCKCRTDAAVKQFLAFRLGEVSANHASLASELRAVKVHIDIVRGSTGDQGPLTLETDHEQQATAFHCSMACACPRSKSVHLACRWTGRQLLASWTRQGSSWRTPALRLSERLPMPQHSDRRRRPLLWRPQPHSWPTFGPSLRGELGSSAMYIQTSADRRQSCACTTDSAHVLRLMLPRA